MGFGITFSPLVPNEILWAALAVALIAAVLLLVIRSRGSVMRATALAFAALALANPSLTREDREALPSVAVVVVDKSPSQGFGDREKQTEAVRAAVTQRLGRIAGSKCAWSKPAMRTARPTARACSPRSARRSPTCRRIASRARCSSPTAACMTCRPRPRSLASTRRCMR